MAWRRPLDFPEDSGPRSRPKLGPACLHRDDFPPPAARGSPGLAAASTLGSALRGAPQSSPRASAGGPVCASASRGVPPEAASGQEGLDRLGKRRLIGQLVDLSALEGGASPTEVSSRQKACAAIQRCIQAAWEGSTTARYDYVLRGPVSELESASGVPLLPCSTDMQFMVLFSHFEGSPWNSVVTAKAAVRGWHVQRNLLGAWERAWTERTSLFWRGLKKRCDHTLSAAKRPLSIAELAHFVTASQNRGSPAAVRNAASAAVCFFWNSPLLGDAGAIMQRRPLQGVRRGASRPQTKERPFWSRHALLHPSNAAAWRWLPCWPASRVAGA